MAIDKLKTKFFTGAWLTDVKHYFSKINEIIDNINIGSRPYKVLTLKVSQTGTSDPTWIVLENTLISDIYELRLSRVSFGYFVINVTDILKPEDKCVAFIGNGIITSPSDIKIQYDTPTSYLIFSYDSSATLSDSILSDTFIEIRVYN